MKLKNAPDLDRILRNRKRILKKFTDAGYYDVEKFAKFFGVTQRAIEADLRDLGAFGLSPEREFDLEGQFAKREEQIRRGRRSPQDSLESNGLYYMPEVGSELRISVDRHTRYHSQYAEAPMKVLAELVEGETSRRMLEALTGIGGSAVLSAVNNREEIGERIRARAEMQRQFYEEYSRHGSPYYGETQKEIAERHNVSEAVVQKGISAHRQRHGLYREDQVHIQSHRGRAMGDARAEVCAIASGAPEVFGRLSEIASEAGVTPETIMEWIVQNGSFEPRIDASRGEDEVARQVISTADAHKGRGLAPSTEESVAALSSRGLEVGHASVLKTSNKVASYIEAGRVDELFSADEASDARDGSEVDEFEMA